MQVSCRLRQILWTRGMQRLGFGDARLVEADGEREGNDDYEGQMGLGLRCPKHAPEDVFTWRLGHGFIMVSDDMSD